MKEKTGKHNTGSPDYKPRRRNKRRTNTKNGAIRIQTEKQNNERKTLQIL